MSKAEVLDKLLGIEGAAHILATEGTAGLKKRLAALSKSSGQVTVRKDQKLTIDQAVEYVRKSQPIDRWANPERIVRKESDGASAQRILDLISEAEALRLDENALMRLIENFELDGASKILATIRG